MKLTQLEIGLLILLLSPITDIIIVSIIEKRRTRKEKDNKAETISSEKIPYKKTCKKKEWEEILLPSEYEALNGVIYIPPESEMTSDEVFDAIVDYKGGLASGYEIRSIISRVYGVELG